MEKELRILMVEDVTADAELEVRELKRAGLRVAHRLVETEEAFRLALKEFQPGIILSDFSMPHFDGMFALALACELVPDVPFIFVSGTMGEEYAIRALKNGATDYVLKDNLVRLPSAVERALKDREETAARRIADARHRATFDNAPIGIMHTDLDTDRILVANPKLVELLGYTQDELRGMTTDDILLPDNRGIDRSKYRERMLKGELSSFSSERKFVRKNGSIVWVNRTISLVRDAAGDPLYFIRMVEDITERKSQELRIFRLNRIYEVLSGINSAIVRIRDREQLFREACRIAVEHGGFGIAWIGMLDAKTQVITPVACAGVQADSFLAYSPNSVDPVMPIGQGIVGRALRERRAVYSNDIAAERTQGGARRQEALRRGYRSVISFPLLVEEVVAGSLSLFAKEPNFFDDDEIKLLTELAGDISFALEHIAKEEKLSKLTRIRLVSGEINAAIVHIREREALLRETCRIAAEHGKFELVWIALLDEENKKVNPVAWTGFSPEAANAVTWETIGSSQGTLGEAIRTRKASVRNDIEQQYFRGRLRQEALKMGCRSTVCLPIVVDDRVAALISLYVSGRGFFDKDELALLEELAADVSFALQSMSRQEKLDYLSYYEVLTGLPNRTLFNDRLDQRIRAARDGNQIFSVMMLDIERFRLVNDTLGRAAGDDLLRQSSQRLKNALENVDLLACFGGDHFAIATRRAGESENIVHILEQVLTGLTGKPFRLDDHELHIAARTGIAMYPSDGADVDTLLRNAEAALKDAKRAGQRYVFYAPQMNARVAERLKLENNLRNALSLEQYVLHYQPRFDLATRSIVGMEALIRWQHPERGMVPPGEFIQLLEETGMILEVGLWAISQAAHDHVAWCAKGLKPPRIAVNVSQVQLRRNNFVDSVRGALAAVDRAPDRIDIEITESMLMEDIEDCIDKLKALQSMGLQVALDDFGTGYSSLSYLARLPINSLKVDRSFVIQMLISPEQMAIVSTVISLARALNLKVVAEGVESEEQAHLLKLLRCDEGQGYLFAKPMSAADIERLLPAA